MRVRRLIVDGMFLLIGIGLLVYTISGKRTHQPQPRWVKVSWLVIGLTALDRLVYDFMG